MENKCYSIADISKIFGLSIQSIYRKINANNIEADFIIIGENYRPKQMFLFSNVSKYFDCNIFIPIPKKERKQYFEFSEITLESKINN